MRRTRVVGSVLAGALLLAGCAGEEAVPERTKLPAPVEAAEPERTEPEPEPTEDDVEQAPTAGGELAAPGTQVAVGQPAVVHVQALEEGEEFYGYALVETTVTEIVEGDPALFAQFENAADFEGLVPYFVHAEHRILSIEGQPNSNMIPSLRGRLADGSEAGAAISFGGALSDACPSEYFDEKVAGAVASTCIVALAQAGTPVTGATWHGDDYADGSMSENPYYDDPVAWVQD